jgi:flagellar basal-body rod modification protein FlgD
MNALVGIRAMAADRRDAASKTRMRAAEEVNLEMRPIAKALATKAVSAASQTAPASAASAANQTMPASAPAAAGQTAAATAAAKAASTGSTDTSGTRTVKKELDQDTFLQLLVLQMQNQDPLAPTDNTQMIAQLAQFSSLEQMNNLNTSFNTLSGNMNQLNFVSAGALLGRTVSGTDAAGALQQGKVERVYLDSSSGGVYLQVNGQAVAMSNIQQIE